MTKSIFAILLWSCCAVVSLGDEIGEVRLIVDRAVKSAGGSGKLPDIVRWKERWYLGESKQGNDREAIIRFPDDWFQNDKNIAKDSADRAEKAYMVGVWALWSLKDDKSRLALLPSIEVAGRPADGLRVSREGQKDIDLFFDHATGQLRRMDWRKYQVFFDNWQEADGYHYPAKSTVRLADGTLYMWTEFLEFERLKELPVGLAP